MAAKVINDINEKVLLCTICQGRFDTPKILGCHHSFCLKCIKAWVNNNHGVLSCPMCRSEFDIPNKGLVDLPPSYFINQLLEYMTDVETIPDTNCVMCNLGGTVHCIECSSYLCNQCSENHYNFSVCQNHTVIPLKKYESMNVKEKAATKPVMCPKHNNVSVKSYCAQCSLPVCRKCTEYDHIWHDLQELNTAFEGFKTDAKETLVDCSDKVDKINAELKKHSEDTNKQKQSVMKCEEEVKRYAETLHQMVNRAKKKMLNELAERSHKILRSRMKKRLDKVEKLAQLRNVSLFIESLIKAPLPAVALFDSSKSLTKAKNLIDKQKITLQTQSQQRQDMFLRRPYIQQISYKLQQRAYVPPNNMKDKNTEAMSFYFEENKQLDLSAFSIGSIKCQTVNLQPPEQPLNQRQILTPFVSATRASTMDLLF